MPAERASGEFAMVVRDEVWNAGDRAPRERRLSHGIASMSGAQIVASDERDEELLAVVDSDLAVASAALQELSARELTARVVVSARRVAGVIMRESVIALSRDALSLLSAPNTLRADADQLTRIAEVPPEIDADVRALPMYWRNGTASVLLHEAAGHPAEHGQPPVDWPAWLSVRDEPSVAVDDTGATPSAADLARGEQPTVMRRATFGDVPLRRLSNVVVSQEGAPFEPASGRIEVLLVAGGRYDPLTGVVRVFVSAADVIEGDHVRRARPFVVESSREAVARSIRGAAGEPERYPGVVCSYEGQEIFVGSYAPMLVTHF